MITRRKLAALAAGAATAPSSAWALQGAPKPPALEELISDPALVDCAISPDGKTVATLRHVQEGEKRTARITIHPFEDVDAGKTVGVPERTGFVEWANNDRLALVISTPRVITSGAFNIISHLQLGFLNKAGTSLEMTTQTLAGQRLAFGGIVDILPQDPERILVKLVNNSQLAPLLYAMNINTQALTLLDRGLPTTLTWFIQNGEPVMRLDANRSGKVVSLMSRTPGESRWVLVRSFPASELFKPEFTVLGPTNEPGFMYVAARAEGDDTVGLHRFDLKTQSLAGVVSRRAGRDLDSLMVDKYGRYIGAAYVDDRVTYDLADKDMVGHLAEINQAFWSTNNVRIFDASADGNRLIVHAEGPKLPGAFAIFDRAQGAIGLLGEQRPWLGADRLAEMLAVDIKTRDGASIRAYLTVPPGRRPYPLVVMPHGGPEVRDQIGYDPTAQALAAQGWLVLQPNFRGSGGYGEAFARAGDRRWNGRVMEDLEDAVDELIRTGVADKNKVAIMGASFGGYAALMSAVRRPALYRAVVSRAGVSHLSRMLETERADGDDSLIYRHWVKRIGDPRADAAMISQASPALRADEILAPVLLYHGQADEVVPLEQSKFMNDALRRARKSCELVEVKSAGHSEWPGAEEIAYLKRCTAFIKAAFDKVV